VLLVERLGVAKVGPVGQSGTLLAEVPVGRRVGVIVGPALLSVTLADDVRVAGVIDGDDDLQGGPVGLVTHVKMRA
jgi:hypothetical protein